jgi:hypothetical protein
MLTVAVGVIVWIAAPYLPTPMQAFVAAKARLGF